MNLAAFFNSTAGMYAAQSFCHSIIASILSDRALKAWSITDPAVRQRFRLVVVLVPIFSFPLFQMINHDRSDLPFRLDALFDVNRWLTMELWGVPIGLPFLILLAATSLVFLFQEMVPIIIHTLESRKVLHEGSLREPDEFLRRAAGELSLITPAVCVVDDDELLIFSTTGRNPAIFISEGLIQALTPGELEAALAHELAHIARSRRPLLLAAFFLRIVMFFNPVALVEFRRAVRNEEKICDDIAVALTGRPEALAEALRKFRPARKTPESGTGRKPLFAPANLEEYSHALQLDGRITRLMERLSERPGKAEGWIYPFLLTVLAASAINYFIV